MEYRYGIHTVYSIEDHFVWVTKYRYKVLSGDVAVRVRELVRQTCDLFEIQILQGVVSKDHVHILVQPGLKKLPFRQGLGACNLANRYPFMMVSPG